MSQFFEYLKMAMSNIKSNKIRSFLTMLGIIIGISSVILIMSLGNGAKNVITEELAGIGAGQISMYVYDETGTYSITQDDITAIKSTVDGIRGVTSYMSAPGSTTTNKGEFDVSGTGEMPDGKYFLTTDMKSGRYFNEKEYQSGANVAVISEDDAVRLFGSSDVVGKDITVTMYGKEISLNIIGVLAKEENSLLSFTYDNSPVSVTFPMTFLSQVYGMEIEEFSNVYLLTDDGANASQVTAQVKDLMERRHQSHGQDIFQFESFNDIMSIVDTVINVVTMLISLIAAISLVVGGIGVMNIMLVSVTERTREIGIRKALGAKTRSIMLQFLSESAIITLIGGTIGILSGIGSANLIAYIIQMINPTLSFTPSISISMIIATTLFSSAIGLFFGIYPAKKAASLSPIEALRRNS